MKILDVFGRPPAGSCELGKDEIHAWVVPLAGSTERFEGVLSAEEQDRAERFRFVDHRRRYAVSRGALRCILGGYCGARPEDLVFGTGRRGKPFLQDRAHLHFNVSHSGQLAIVGVAGTEIGVDIEKIRHLENSHDLARRHFSGAEFALLQGLPESEHLGAFYRCWTRKEAYIKALGEGLSLPLDSFDVSLDSEPRFLAIRDRPDRPEDWLLRDVSPAEGYAGALAARGRDLRIRCFRFGD